MSKNIYNIVEAISALCWGENIAVLLTLNTSMDGQGKKRKKQKRKKGCDNNNFCHKTVSSGYLLNIETSTKISAFYTMYNII